MPARPREIVERTKRRWHAAQQDHAWLDHTFEYDSTFQEAEADDALPGAMRLKVR